MVDGGRLCGITVIVRELHKTITLPIGGTVQLEGQMEYL